jgi:tetratricopeptide (TPR) repeat protein
MAAGPKTGRLFIETIPENSRIRILNIQPKFKQGIYLKPGKYSIEISAKGYETKKIWINVKAGEDNKIIASIEKKISQTLEARATETPEKPKKHVDKINKESDIDILKKGHYYRDRGEYEKSIEYYLQLFRRNPFGIESVYSLGFAHLKLGNSDKAIEFFKQATKIDPFDPEPYFNLGLVYFIIEDKESTVELHKKLKTLDTVLADKLLKYINILD